MRATLFVLTAFFLAGAAFSGASAAQPSTRPEASSPATDVSAQQRKRRPRVLIYRQRDDRGVYPSYYPGPNAVRDCSVRYVQEFRPSGTVIVPDMKCFWRQP